MLAYESLWRIRWRMFLEWSAKNQEKALEDLQNIVSPVVELFRMREKPARELFQTSVSNLEGYIQSQNLTDLLNKFDTFMSTSKIMHFGCNTSKWLRLLRTLSGLSAKAIGNSALSLLLHYNHG